MVRSKSLNRAVIATENMPDAPQGYDYVLWFQRGADMEAAGAMPGRAEQRDRPGRRRSQRGRRRYHCRARRGLPSEPSDQQVALIGFEQA